MTTLVDWQKRLSAHFESLASARSADPKRGVFALEHGLDPAEVADLQAAVRQAAQTRTSESKAPLPWIVYATELGYRYSGDEYWQTFEEETPGWAGYWERNWLRDQFIWFHKKFHGVRSVGAWAQHFSIICWPITNAVLPRDLQLQLARILYGMAYRLNFDLLNSPEKLGLAIAERSWDASPRFQNLAQESLLMGQIATALLLEGKAASESLILPTTLRRIGADLNREQQSKEWLRKARGIAIERLKVKGLAPDRPGGGQELEARQREELKSIALEPRFVLRPSFTSTNSWTVFLQIPELSPIIELVPEARDILLESRCVVAGTTGRPLARGRLVQGAQHIPLSKWPNPGEPLLAFDRKSPKFDYILRSFFSMSSGPVWLFRVASDGLAYELRDAGVRSGQTYLLLDKVSNAVTIPGAVPIAVECDGIQALLLKVSDALEGRDIEALKNKGIGVAKSLRVWPAGVGAIVWDGEGRGEWLVTERACFAVKADHSIKSLAALINQEHIELGAVSAGETIFLALPLLAPGHHVVTLQAQAGPFTPATSVGKLDIYLRPARTWEAGKGAQGPLLVDVDPLNATLEQLRESRVDVSIRGPLGREMDCIVHFFQRGTDPPVFDRRLARLTLPVTPDAWNRYLQKHLFALREVENLYDSSNICVIQLHAGELGILSLRFERESLPVRWAVRARGHNKQIALVSDVAQEQPVEVAVRTFEKPDLEERQDSSSFKGWCDVPAHGGLFIARVGAFASNVILPPVVHKLGDLKFNPSINNRARSLQAAINTLNLVKLWASARLTGNLLSGTRQRAVLRMLTAHLHFVLCGETWERVEQAAPERSASSLLHVFSGRPQELIVAKLCLEQIATLIALTASKRAEWLYQQTRTPLGLSRVWRQIRLTDGTTKLVPQGEGTPSDPQWLCEFALRLASDPGHVSEWAGDATRAGIEKLWNQPIIARLARVLVIAVNKQPSANEHTTSNLYVGWTWR